jgi:hypothetical protein
MPFMETCRIEERIRMLPMGTAATGAWPSCAGAPGGAANDEGAVDVKGWFRTRDQRRIDPLTITDRHSRLLFTELESGDHLVRFGHHDLGLIDRHARFRRFAAPGPGLREPAQPSPDPRPSTIVPVQSVDQQTG